jgi:hypothetical protein
MLMPQLSDDVIDLNPDVVGKVAKRSKYGNVLTEVDGFTFQSKAEALRWLDLRNLERAGEISCLNRQVEYTLQIGFTDSEGRYVKPIYYVADFTYIQGDHWVIEDRKSPATRAESTFRLKWKMLQYKFKDDSTVRLHLEV